jgi:hypothetical protein
MAEPPATYHKLFEISQAAGTGTMESADHNKSNSNSTFGNKRNGNGTGMVRKETTVETLKLRKPTSKSVAAPQQPKDVGEMEKQTPTPPLLPTSHASGSLPTSPELQQRQSRPLPLQTPAQAHVRSSSNVIEQPLLVLGAVHEIQPSVNQKASNTNKSHVNKRHDEREYDDGGGKMTRGTMERLVSRDPFSLFPKASLHENLEFHKRFPNLSEDEYLIEGT